MTGYGIAVTLICIALLAQNLYFWLRIDSLKSQLPKRVNGRFAKRG